MAFSDQSLPPILIYQMGKVGSSTVLHSLKKATVPNSVLHFHRLTDISRRKKLLKERGRLSHELYLGGFICKLLQKKPSFPIKIITLVRDPIALFISGIFHNPHFHPSELVDTKSGLLNPQKVVSYLEDVLIKPDIFSYIYTWFDDELKGVLGIDVLAIPFSREKGYSAYTQDNIDVLLITLESLSSQGPSSIASFLDLSSPLCFAQHNIRMESSSAKVYRDVVQNIRLSSDVCESIYSSSFVRHFYSEDMINTFKSKWMRND